jgi:hypothetical protein
VPAGTVAAEPRNTESLCSLVRSTPMLVAFSGMFTLDPVEEVSVIVFISTMKERRFVLGGGVSGVAVAVKLSVAVPPPGGGVFFDPPLQEIRETADSKTSEAKTFRKFTRPPTADGAEPKAGRHSRPTRDFIAHQQSYGCKRNVDCSTAKYEGRITRLRKRAVFARII